MPIYYWFVKIKSVDTYTYASTALKIRNNLNKLKVIANLGNILISKIF